MRFATGRFAEGAIEDRLRRAHRSANSHGVGVEGEEPGYTMPDDAGAFDATVEDLLAHVRAPRCGGGRPGDLDGGIMNLFRASPTLERREAAPEAPPLGDASARSGRFPGTGRQAASGHAGGMDRPGTAKQRRGRVGAALVWVVGLSFALPRVAAAQPETQAEPSETVEATGAAPVEAAEPGEPSVSVAEGEGATPAEEGAAAAPEEPATPGEATGAPGLAAGAAAAVSAPAAVEPEVEGGPVAAAAAAPESPSGAEPEATPEAASGTGSGPAPGAASGGATLAEAAVAGSGGGGDGGGAAAGAGIDWANVELEGRLYVVWRLTDEPDRPGNEFLLNTARLQATWAPMEWARAVLELEVEEALRAGSAQGLLRDAYVELSPFGWLHVLAGQFKRPFSRIELMQRRNLRTIDRGAANAWIVERLGYGGRDLGVALAGRLWKAINLDYAVGVFNGPGEGLLESGGDGFKDLSARLDARPVDWFSFGLSFSLDTLETADLPRLVDAAVLERNPYFVDQFGWVAGSWWMTGADVVFRPADLRLLVEASLGENWWYEGAPLTSTVTFEASYEFELSEEWGLGLEPVFRGELVLPRIAERAQRKWRATAGANLLLGSHVRVMVEGRFTRVEGEEPNLERTPGGPAPNEWPGGWEDVNCLLVQLALDV